LAVVGRWTNPLPTTATMPTATTACTITHWRRWTRSRP
jgi:hypothetical protein